MNSGRELDALVAEKVMGWHKGKCGECKNRPWLAEDYQCQFWHDQNGKDTDSPVNDIWSGGMGDSLQKKAWSPSTDIAVAWQVIGKYPQALVPLSDGKWWCGSEYGLGHSVGKQNGWFECLLNVANGSIAETAPHAICLAVLKAVGYDFSASKPSQK